MVSLFPDKIILYCASYPCQASGVCVVAGGGGCKKPKVLIKEKHKAEPGFLVGLEDSQTQKEKHPSPVVG